MTDAETVERQTLHITHTRTRCGPGVLKIYFPKFQGELLYFVLECNHQILPQISQSNETGTVPSNDATEGRIQTEGRREKNHNGKSDRQNYKAN